MTGSVSKRHLTGTQVSMLILLLMVSLGTAGWWVCRSRTVQGPIQAATSVTDSLPGIEVLEKDVCESAVAGTRYEMDSSKKVKKKKVRVKTKAGKQNRNVRPASAPEGVRMPSQEEL